MAASPPSEIARLDEDSLQLIVLGVAPYDFQTLAHGASVSTSWRDAFSPRLADDFDLLYHRHFKKTGLVYDQGSAELLSAY